MAETKLKGTPIQTCGDLPAVGAPAPAFTLVGANLGEVTLDSFTGKRKVLNIFPSIDTGICRLSVLEFAKRAKERDDFVVLDISADLPFAAARFCKTEGVEATTLSTFRAPFAKDYGVEMTDGPMKGLCARAVIVLDADNVVRHVELVPEIVQEPDYEAAAKALG